MDKGIDLVADTAQQADMHAPPRISRQRAVQFVRFSPISAIAAVRVIIAMMPLSWY